MSRSKNKKRNIVKLKNKSITKFPAQKSSSSTIVLESPLERDFCYHIEFDDAVISYEPQPVGYKYVLEGKVRSYTPDFEVFFENASAYYEVKYLSDIENDDTFEKEFKAKQEGALDLGKELFLVTDDFIAKHYKYENLCLLYKSVDFPINKEYLRHVKRVFSNFREVTISDLIRQDSRNSDFCSVHKLIWTKRLKADIESEILSLTSTVYPGDLA